MAVGTVSGIEPDDNWQLISSVTASGTAVTFNSISGYKRLMVVWKVLTTGTSQWYQLRVNNDSTAGNHSSMNSYTFGDANSSNTSIMLTGMTRTNASGMLTIENANKSAPHPISNFASDITNATTMGILTSDPITRVDIFGSASASWTGGTIQLWGVAG